WRFLFTRLNAGDREAGVQSDPHRGAACAHDLEAKKAFIELSRFIEIAALQGAVREHSNLKDRRRFRRRLMFLAHFVYHLMHRFGWHLSVWVALSSPH